MSSSTWIIISWVLVAALTGINIFVFLKLRGAALQMKSLLEGKGGLNPAMLQQAMQMMQRMQAQGGGNPFQPPRRR